MILASFLVAPASAIRLPVVRRRDAVALGAAAGLGQRAASAAESGSPAARLEELKTLGARAEQSQAKQTPAFWPGRLEGQPPPTPRVVLKDAPPIVILPGFGNDRVDYIAPNGLAEEVSLRAALTRRGVDSVPVVPIERKNWLNVAKGLSDPQFVAGNAQPEGPAFSWYVAKAKATVEQAVAARGERVVLVGHSAGGWLARALLCVAGDAWALKNVRGVVTLGAPHATPPPSVADQTRGTIPNVNNRQPGAFYKKDGVFYVCVSSKRVIGDEAGDGAAKNGFTAYRLILGEGQGVAGDGFVPIEAAFLDGATTLTLNCFHSGGSADPWPLDDWYGAEANVDAWLEVVGRELAAQQRK